MTGFSNRGLANFAGVLTLAGGLAVAAVVPARADLVFDFNSLQATGGRGNCTYGDCQLNGPVQSFTTGGITLGAYSYAGTSSPSSTGTYVSQRFGTGTNEVGLGVFSGTDSTTNGSSLEISSSEFLLLDNSAAIKAGYTLSSLSLSSIQSGEGGAIKMYYASAIGSTLTLGDLKPIATLSNPGSGTLQVQTYDFSPTNDTYNYIVVTASNSTNLAGNVLIQQEALNYSTSNNGGTPVPEPSSLLLYGTFALGLGFATWRRRAICG